MHTLVLVFHVLLAMAIVGLVLLQQGRGADAGASFGSGGSGTVFGAAGAMPFLAKVTAGLALLFILTSLGLAMMAREDARAFREAAAKQKASSGSVVIDRAAPAGAPAAAASGADKPAVPEAPPEEKPAVPEAPAPAPALKAEPAAPAAAPAVEDKPAEAVPAARETAPPEAKPDIEAAPKKDAGKHSPKAQDQPKAGKPKADKPKAGEPKAGEPKAGEKKSAHPASRPAS